MPNRTERDHDKTNGDQRRRIALALATFVVGSAAFTWWRLGPWISSLGASPDDLQFNGRVVDQDGRPVVAARVEYDVVEVNFMAGGAQGHVTTDLDGVFRIRHADASALGFLNITAKGYDVAIFDQTKLYSALGSAAPRSASWKECVESSPCVFHAWRYPKDEPLPEMRRMRAGESIKAGDVRSWNFSEPWLRNAKEEKAPFDIEVAVILEDGTSGASARWTLELRPTHGGILKAAEPFEPLAPTEGYADLARMTFRQRESARENFYLRFGDKPQFARLTLERDAFGGDRVAVTLEVSINDTGGRSLDKFDGLKALR